jgi:hypothetical protein
MKKQLIIFLISNLLFFGCNKPDDVSEEFKEYLKQTFDIQPTNGNLYLFIPANQCESCIMLNASKLSSEFNKRLFIFSALQKKHFKGFNNYYRDKKDKLQELKLVDYENKFVFFDHDKVECVVKANLNSLQSAKRSCPSP